MTYRILEGVHRCVAAHLVGLTEVQAVIDTGGAYGPVEAIPLDTVYSPKASIGRWDRRRDFHVLLQIMADATQRVRMWPVVLAVLPPGRVKYFTRVADVVVTP